MHLIFRVAILLGFVLFSGFSAASDPEIEIKQMLDFLADEWTEGDMDSIRGHIHRDFVLITSDGVRTREQRLNELEIVMAPGKDHGELRYSNIQVGNQETSLSPTIPAMIKNRQVILNISRDSPNKIIPRIATPTAPIPVHTA